MIRPCLRKLKKRYNMFVIFNRRMAQWAYGTLPYHQSVDNFHTGHNLECIFIGKKCLKSFLFRKHRERTALLSRSFFTSEGISKYYNDKVYPVDIHAPAQMIVTLRKLESFKKHEKLIE